MRSVHSQLAQINSAIIAIQTHSLRQTGGVALTLSVLMVIAWKVIRRMRLPGKGVTTVAIALVLATTGGALLSRSLLGSGAARTRATQANVLVLLNQQRAAHGLKPLRVDLKLTRAAAAHTADMLRRGYFSHNGPQGAWEPAHRALREAEYPRRDTRVGRGFLRHASGHR